MARIPITACELVTGLGTEASESHQRWLSADPSDGVDVTVDPSLPVPPQPWSRDASADLRAAWAAVSRLSVPLADAARRWGPARLGVVAGIRTGEASPASSPEALLELVRQVARARGPAYAVTGGQAASGRALRSAVGLLEENWCDAVVVVATAGSAEARTDFWSARGESGVRPGEGSAIVLLERQARADAELVAVASADEPRAAVEAALAQAGLGGTDLSWVLCGGDGRRDVERQLAASLCSTLGPSTPVTSPTGFRGSLGPAQDVAGVVEAVFSARSGRVGPLASSSALSEELRGRGVTRSVALETDYVLCLHAGVEADFTAIIVGAREP